MARHFKDSFDEAVYHVPSSGVVIVVQKVWKILSFTYHKSRKEIGNMVTTKEKWQIIFYYITQQQ
ncbi:MAG: hypothetical protein DYG83_09950 [Candidatus Brocadia sp. AMX2]|uniref:tRNA and rRNA cytosine-C5-methylases n=1 Tax=Candidatus Brocadia sinica JPN1 TaxID=1197129 RepID=A0ABQ0K277_9BACT|nr:MAG: hypothetical protein EDM70_11655 [Candidatus Brocadia sp. AMX2]MBC6932701.1 hypothetical protein [Candidatus Brocadia sp.]MBL1169592.1 hypothetical protein [Candidatus Brocadia sp. AMX1]GAN35207.1 tRNA and rRNA cytosine-C5-methylases [Candidatus Brocadia sinica JPN1]MCE7867132.1 hypothetical protein [Candidatus Brocadia sp. AMX2]